MAFASSLFCFPKFLEHTHTHQTHFTKYTKHTSPNTLHQIHQTHFTKHTQTHTHIHPQPHHTYTHIHTHTTTQTQRERGPNGHLATVESPHLKKSLVRCKVVSLSQRHGSIICTGETYTQSRIP